MAISSDIKLTIYNGALRRLGSRGLASLTENREPRRVLDGIWGSGDRAVIQALERGEWNFALRTVQADYSPSVEPGFDFRRAFDKPADFRRLAALSADEYLRMPLTNEQYVDEAGFWFTDQDVLYVRYVSDDTDYGTNAGIWPEVFTDYLEIYLALNACERLTNATGLRDRLVGEERDALKRAKSHDAMNEGVKFLPGGSWSGAKRRSSRSDR